MIKLETHIGERSKRAVYEVRDTVFHLSEALQDGTSDDDARRHLNEAEDHLRRAIVEPMEFLAEEKLNDLTELLIFRLSMKGRLMLLSQVPPPAIRRKIDEGKAALRECRQKKACTAKIVDALNAAQKAATIFEDAYYELGPKEIHANKVTILTHVTGGILVVIVLAIAAAICKWGLSLF